MKNYSSIEYGDEAGNEVMTKEKMSLSLSNNNNNWATESEPLVSKNKRMTLDEQPREEEEDSLNKSRWLEDAMKNDLKSERCHQGQQICFPIAFGVIIGIVMTLSFQYFVPNKNNDLNERKRMINHLRFDDSTSKDFPPNMTEEQTKKNPFLQENSMILALTDKHRMELDKRLIQYDHWNAFFLQDWWNTIVSGTQYAWNKTVEWFWGSEKATEDWFHNVERDSSDWFNHTERDAGDWINHEETDVANWWNQTEHGAEDWWSHAGQDTADWFSQTGKDVADWWNHTEHDAEHWFNDAEHATVDWFNQTEHEASNWIQDAENKTAHWLEQEDEAALDWFDHEANFTKHWFENITHQNDDFENNGNNGKGRAAPIYLNTSWSYRHFCNLGGFMDYSQDFFELLQGHDVQINQAYCAVASVAAVLNSYRGSSGLPSSDLPVDTTYFPHHYATQHNIWNECTNQNVILMNTTFNGLLDAPPGGLNMAQTVRLLECQFNSLPDDVSFTVTPHHVDPLEETIHTLRQSLVRALLNPDTRILINYHRRSVRQEGGGHWSPIGAYSKTLDAFLVMDVAKYKYPFAWIPTSSLYDALQTYDSCGTWDFPHGQNRLPPYLLKPQSQFDHMAALGILKCIPQRRGYILIHNNK